MIAQWLNNSVTFGATLSGILRWVENLLKTSTFFAGTVPAVYSLFAGTVPAYNLCQKCLEIQMILNQEGGGEELQL